MIYFVEAIGLDRVKIGLAEDIPRRLKSLRTASPVPLQLIRVMEGGASEEQELHDRFHPARTHGEWFVLSTIRDALERLPEPTPGPKTKMLKALMGPTKVQVRQRQSEAETARDRKRLSLWEAVFR